MKELGEERVDSMNCELLVEEENNMKSEGDVGEKLNDISLMTIDR